MGGNRGSGRLFERHRFHRLTEGWELTPLTGALLYLVFGFVSLYVSDVVFVRHFTEPMLSQVQAVKAGVEILLTGALMFVLIRKSRDPLERTNEALERRQEELQVLHRVLRHNLRNDLNVIRGVTDALQVDAPSARAADCEQIRESTEEILHYIQQANQIRRVTEGSDELATYDLGTRIPALVESLDGVIGNADVSVLIPDGATVEVNHMFDAAIEELLTNAVQHNDGETPRISITVSEDGGYRGMTEIRVEDDGPGIPADVPRILARSEHDQVDHLDGMGLWFVYWAVTESGGELGIEDSELGGSCVRMWLPQGLSISSDAPLLPTR